MGEVSIRKYANRYVANIQRCRDFLIIIFVPKIALYQISLDFVYTWYEMSQHCLIRGERLGIIWQATKRRVTLLNNRLTLPRKNAFAWKTVQKDIYAWRQIWSAPLFFIIKYIQYIHKRIIISTVDSHLSDFFYAAAAVAVVMGQTMKMKQPTIDNCNQTATEKIEMRKARLHICDDESLVFSCCCWFFSWFFCSVFLWLVLEKWNGMESNEMEWKPTHKHCE